LRTLGLQVIEHPYPDHYDFSLTELWQYTEHPIVVTSKDAVKIKALWLQQQQHAASSEAAKIDQDWHALAARLWVLPVSAELSAACYQTLEQQLKALGINTASIDTAAYD